jgi:hypothetical protein
MYSLEPRACGNILANQWLFENLKSGHVSRATPVAPHQERGGLGKVRQRNLRAARL